MFAFRYACRINKYANTRSCKQLSKRNGSSANLSTANTRSMQRDAIAASRLNATAVIRSTANTSSCKQLATNATASAWRGACRGARQALRKEMRQRLDAQTQTHVAASSSQGDATAAGRPTANTCSCNHSQRDATAASSPVANTCSCKQLAK